MTILSETTRYSLTEMGVMILIIGSILCMVILIAAKECVIEWLAIIGVVIGLITIINAFAYNKEPYQEIKAVISDDYPAIELYDKYDVVKRDGEIWILNERIEK